ncbi:Leucine efflux protein [Pseudovibrio axinellae]|uniref:Leucine efflux protein n=1 Tax=Pseudovibrio axinellae TaxID=989403 RepID=A0A161XFU7_9HYPH|nr:LysE family translocator [Pseudovibrio axinellae]KZL19631.1 Leucine efflux protein [Pseudovibrio axinellae]SEQ34879.1 Threonine/homoserine/homoserine lactone efflux protein [Pseudovibrio axinellae]
MATNTLLFLITILSLIVVPGPDMLYVTSRALASGRPAALKASLGISAGYLVFTVLVAAGFQSLFMAEPRLFQAIRWVGLAYLMYLAYRLFFAQGMWTSDEEPQAPAHTNDLKFGFLTSLLNPKGMLFYFSLLPQFYVPEAMPFWIYALVFGFLASLLCLIVYYGIGSLVSGPARLWLANSDNGKRVSMLASLCVFAVGISMVVADMA